MRGFWRGLLGLLWGPKRCQTNGNVPRDHLKAPFHLHLFPLASHSGHTDSPLLSSLAVVCSFKLWFLVAHA